MSSTSNTLAHAEMPGCNAFIRVKARGDEVFDAQFENGAALVELTPDEQGRIDHANFQ